MVRSASESSRLFRWVVIGIVALIAALLRGQQWFDQVLNDDEWHAIHQVMMSSPTQIATSFGLADYSIPLTLFYVAIAQFTDLNETIVRAPMYIAGLLFIALAVNTTWRHLGPREAVLLGLFLAASPLLFTYSRLARPYALTLLLAPMAIWIYAAWWQRGGIRLAGAYLAVAVLAAWLHLIVAPFVLAPHLWGLWTLRREREKSKRWFGLGFATAAMLLIIVGPPFIVSPRALAEKAAVDLPTFGTFVGAFHQWVGVGSVMIMAGLLVFAVIGAKQVWRAFGAIAPMYVLGLGLTLLAVLVMQPAWIQHPLTFARYLLPAMPVVLLCIAAGMVVCADAAHSDLESMLGLIVVTLAFLASTFLTTPLHEMLQRPQQYATHSWFHFDVRRHKNPNRSAFEPMRGAQAWKPFAIQTRGPLTLAVAPWSLFSYENEHPMLQSLVGQRLLPASTLEICSKWEGGAPIPGQRVTLRNFVFLANDADLRAKGVDYVMLKTSPLGSAQTGNNVSACTENLTLRFGPPVAQDDVIQIFKISK